MNYQIVLFKNKTKKNPKWKTSRSVGTSQRKALKTCYDIKKTLNCNANLNYKVDVFYFIFQKRDLDRYRRQLFSFF